MAPTDPVTRGKRLRAKAAAVDEEDENCPECGHPEHRHYVDGSCEICSRCDARDDDESDRFWSGEQLLT